MILWPLYLSPKDNSALPSRTQLRIFADILNNVNHLYNWTAIYRYTVMHSLNLIILSSTRHLFHEIVYFKQNSEYY